MSDDLDVDLEKAKEQRPEPLDAYETDHEDLQTSSQHSDPDSIHNDSDGQQGFPPIEKTESRLSRMGTASLQRANSTLSAIRSRKPVPPFSHPLTHEKTKPDVIVDFDGPDDPYRPINWSFKKKAWTTALYGFTTAGATFASSVYSPAVDTIADEYHVGSEVSLLGISLLLFGFGLGPLLWAPLSEVYGRKKAVLIPYFIAAIFAFATGASKDIAAICITRFFFGLFASAPITNSGGALGDIWVAEQRGLAIVGYAMAIVGGPTLGPIVGGAIIVTGTDWRWVQYVTGIFMMVVLFLDVLILDESYAPVLLVYKAQKLRHESGNWALHARHEEWDVSLSELANKYLVRPFQLLCTPICFLVALYASFTYGILYASLAAFPIEFEEIRGWNALVGTLPFLALLIGILIGAALNVINQRFYTRAFRAAGNHPVPEARLPPMMFGSFSFCIGLFVFAWTSGPAIPWIAPCIGAALIGLGFFTIFQAALNYLIDTFQRYAASAVAANTFLRSVFAGAFPLFITPLLTNLGVPWGMSIFAFFSVGLIPIPFLFYIYGERIRARGFWSKESVFR